MASARSTRTIPSTTARTRGVRRIAEASALRIDLALQGGGSHGAFTWGVLDRLLDDEGLAFAGVSGTSAGALNAAVLATGWPKADEPARRPRCAASGWTSPRSTRLTTAAVSATGAPACRRARPAMEGYNLDWNPFYVWSSSCCAGQPLPVQPAGHEPLRAVVERHVKAALRGPWRSGAVHHRHRGAHRPAAGVRPPRPFHRRAARLGLPAAAVPRREIDGEPYWDGGYSGNPALWPLIYDTDVLDVLLVKINPLCARARPTRRRDRRPRQRDHLQRRAGGRDARHRLRQPAGRSRAGSMPAISTRTCACTWWPTTTAWRR
jgi:NTE family protein